jgi:hypothetical protein
MRPEPGAGFLGRVAASGELVATFLLGAALIGFGGLTLAWPKANPPLRERLAARPADPAGWLQLAQDEGSLKALRLSILTGPREGPLLVPRADFLLARWAELAPDDRRLAEEQVRLAWQGYPRGLVTAARARHAEDAVRTALADLPGAGAAFDEKLAE